MIVKLHHTMVTIPKGAEAAARSFYCGLLGLPEVEKPEALRPNGGFWLEVGDRQVHVGVQDGINLVASKVHVAYEVSDLEQWRGRLAEQGVEMLESVPIPGMTRFECRDPFGNRLEFLQPLPG